MYSDTFASLRKKAVLSQNDIAQALGVSSRTIFGWENADPPRELSRSDSQAISQLLMPLLIEDQLGDMCEQCFAAIPSELVAIWIVDRHNCLLLPKATRYHEIEKNQRREILTATCVSPLVHLSLTTWPLRSGETLNLAGDAISHHPKKKYRLNRTSHVFLHGICESMLHVPTFTPSAQGPLPILMVSFENKLDPDGKVIVPVEGTTLVFTEDDVKITAALADEFRHRLLQDMLSLDMISGSGVNVFRESQ